MKLIAHVSHFFHPNAFVTPCPSPKISRSLYTTYKSYLYIPHSIKLMKNPSKRQSQCGFPPFRAKVRPSPPYLASAAAVPAPLLRAPWLHAPSLRALGTWIARRGPSLEAEGDGMGWVFLLWLVHGSSGFWHFELRTWSEQILRFDFTAWMVQLCSIVADPDTQLFSHASQLYVYPWPLVRWKCCSYQAISHQAFLAITSGGSCNPLGGWSLKSWIVGGILGLQHIVTSSP